MSKNRNKNAGMDARAKIGTLIGKGAVFDGNLTAPEAIRLDGTLNGNCECKDILIVGVDGVINGDVTTENMIIAGKVEGDIIAHGKLELHSTGKLIGNITARSLVVDEDASFDGRCTMTSPDMEASRTNKGIKNTTAADSDKENQNSTSVESDQKNKSRY